MLVLGNPWIGWCWGFDSEEVAAYRVEGAKSATTSTSKPSLSLASVVAVIFVVADSIRWSSWGAIEHLSAAASWLIPRLLRSWRTLWARRFNRPRYDGFS